MESCFQGSESKVLRTRNSTSSQTSKYEGKIKTLSDKWKLRELDLVGMQNKDFKGILETDEEMTSE